MRRLRVLMSAHEFSPVQGSECAVGWNIAVRMADKHDVTVLCAGGPALDTEAYRNAYTRYINENGAIPGLNVVFVSQPPVSLRYSRINRKLMSITHGLGSQIFYYMALDGWHRAAFETARELGFENYDVVHQLNPISFICPGYMWKGGIPFFWGPIGGMYKVPRAFARYGGIGTYFFESLRSWNIERRIRSSGFLNMVRKAERIWTITGNERRIVNGLTEGKALSMLDTACPEQIAGHVRKYDGRRPLELCWSGSHVPLKALPLLLHAISGLPEKRKIILHVLGSGSETGRWQAISRKLNLKNINWHGRLPYFEALRKMGQADIFVHSSFREAASMVVLEALGSGMPVICHDACGMAIAVDDTCGIKVPFENPEKSIKGFMDALHFLINNPEQVERLSSGALTRASLLSWDAKVKAIAGAYEMALGF